MRDPITLPGRVLVPVDATVIHFSVVSIRISVMLDQSVGEPPLPTFMIPHNDITKPKKNLCVDCNEDRGSRLIYSEINGAGLR